jgi:hypothetical protein
MKRAAITRIETWIALICLFLLTSLFFVFAAYRQWLGPGPERAIRRTVYRLYYTPPANKGLEQFDTDKLLVNVKPGERTGLHVLPNQIIIGNSIILSLSRSHEDPKTGIGSRSYNNGPYHVGIVAGSEQVSSVEVTIREQSVAPLEVYPGVWLGKTTRLEITKRFGDPWSWKTEPGSGMGYPTVQRAWAGCDYDVTGILTSFLMMYVGS